MSGLDYAEIRVLATAALTNIVWQDFEAVTDEDVAKIAQGYLTLLGLLRRAYAAGSEGDADVEDVLADLRGAESADD